MKVTETKWVLIDEYKMIVASTNKKSTAQKMMHVYANYVAYNRETKIKRVGEESISFENADFIMIREIFHYTSKKEFVTKCMFNEYDRPIKK